MIFRALLAALLAFFGIRASAQTAPILGCHPNNFLTPWGKGSDYHYVETDKASGRFVWCKQADGGWNIHTWQYWVHDAKPANSWNANDAEKRVKKKAQAATSGVVSLADAASAAIEAEFAAARVAPNEMQRYERARLKYKACLEMTAKPYPVIPPGGFADLPANWCDGFKPGDPPPPEATVYVVTGTAAYPLKADGTRSITPIPEKPVLGSTCNCAQKQILTLVSGVEVRYCAVTIPNVTQLVVAGCKAKP